MAIAAPLASARLWKYFLMRFLPGGLQLTMNSGSPRTTTLETDIFTAQVSPNVATISSVHCFPLIAIADITKEGENSEKMLKPLIINRF